MVAEPQLDLARAAVREAAMQAIGSGTPKDLKLILMHCAAALRAIEGKATDEDRELLDLPLARGYGRPGTDLNRREDFSAEFRDADT